MVAVQVIILLKLYSVTYISQDIFIIPDGAPGALAELERRKFTAEEGASVIAYFIL